MNFPYNRILVVGCGGAGKSVFSRYMGDKFGLPVVHLDKLWWLPGWVERTESEFDGLLSAELIKPRWIMDGNYLRTVDLRLSYADAAVMLDIPTGECLKSVYERADAYRGKTRPDMTHGCEERVDDEFAEWIKNYGAHTRDKIISAATDSGKPFYIFDSRQKAYDWLDGFERN